MYHPNAEHNNFCYRQLFEYAIEGKYKKLQKIFERDGNIPVDITNNKGQTLLYVSCLYQKHKVIVLLLQFGADPNHRSADGSTPTHAAAYSGSPEILRCIVEEYGGDMRLHDKQMQKPRDWALRAGKNFNKKVLRLIELWQDQVDKRMHANGKLQRGVGKVSRSEELLKSNLKIDYCGYGTFLHSSRSHGGGGYFGFAAVVPLASPTHITSPGNLSLSFSIPPSFVMEEALWCHYRVMIKRSKGKSFAISRASEDLLIAEAKACRLVRHPNLLLLMAICVTSIEESYTSTADHWLVYEYIPFGSLFHVLHETKKNFLPTECAKIMIQIADALWFVHQRGFIHCAVSSHAIYLSHGLVAKLGNMCCVTSRGKGASIQDVDAILPHFTRWVAPEVILKDAITAKTDVYGFCVVVCEIFSGSIPWYGCDNINIEDHIKKRRNYFMLPDWLPTELIEMLQNGLKFYSHNRIVNIYDLQGCMASLLESGTFDKMVSCLNAGKIAETNDFNTVTGDGIPDYVQSTLYSHIMSGGNIDGKPESPIYSPTPIGEDVPDAKPMELAHQSKKNNAAQRHLSLSKQVVCSDVGTPVKTASDFREPKFFEVEADVHNEPKPELDEEFLEKEVGDFVTSKETFERKLSSKYPGLHVNPLQRKRPHSCSILTQDGLARELLPAVRHNSFPDITSEMRPPSYASALGIQSRWGKMGCIETNKPQTPLISITGPPDKVYSPRSVPISLSDPTKHATPTSSSKVSSEDKKNKGRHLDSSSSFATYTTIEHLSLPYSLTSNYPSSSDRHAEFSKESDTPSTSAKNSGKDTKRPHPSSESTDAPDSSFVVENIPPPEYAHLDQATNVGCSEDSRSRQQNIKTSDRNHIFYEEKFDLDFPRNSGEMTASSRKVSRTMSYTRDRKVISNSKRTRWSTSALVERREVNNAEFSAEEMYNIGHDDLEFIFESFAERRKHDNSSESISASHVHYDCLVENASYTDKASQTEFRDLSYAAHHTQFDWIEDVVDGQRKPLNNDEGKGDESSQRTYRSVLTNTDINSRPASAGRASPSYIQESPSRHPSHYDETCTKSNFSKVQPRTEVLTHCNLQGKPPPGNESGARDHVLTGDAPFDNSVKALKERIIPMVIKGVESLNIGHTGVTSEDNDTPPSSEYLYSQEFVIPAHAEEEYTSNYDGQYEDLEETNHSSEGDPPASQAYLESDFSSLKVSGEVDSASHSFKTTEVGTSDTNWNMQQLPSENEQFMTCMEGEDLSEQCLVRECDVITESAAAITGRESPSIVEPSDNCLVQSRKPGGSGESVSEMEKYKSTTEVASLEKMFPSAATKPEEVHNVVSQTPSKWSFQKKLCLFKVVAENGNSSNLEKRVLTQNAFSKVRKTAEMFDNLTPPSSPRGAVPEKVISPPPCVTDDTTSSTPNSSKFLQEHAGQIFDTSTPVSADPPINDIRVECKHPITPRTFEEVRRDIETSSVQKCHFSDGSNTTCSHENTDVQLNANGDNEEKQTGGLEVCEASTTFYTDQNSYDELKISPPPAAGIRLMVQGLLNDMIHNAISTLERATSYVDTHQEQSGDTESISQLDEKPTNEPDIDSSDETELNSEGIDVDSDSDESDHHETDEHGDVHRNAVRLSKSVPSVNHVGADETYPPRNTQSVSNINSLIMDASGDRVAQECSSYMSDFDERQQGSNYYRSVDTSIWSL